ncbi:hypothetical protein Nmel_006206 [Mimus melanotis]
MLSQNLCQVCRCLFLCNLKLNSVNVAGLARRIHSSSKKLSDSESKEQTVQKRETEELPPSTENNDFGRLHMPVMLEEVVNCLSPQPGQQRKENVQLLYPKRPAREQGLSTENACRCADFISW